MKKLVGFAGVAGLVAAAGCWNVFFPNAPDQIAETQLRARCHFFYGCCSPVERGLAGAPGAPDEATCVEQGLEQGSSSVILGQRAKAAVDAGKAEVDTALADTCMKAFTDAANGCDASTLLLQPPDAACAAGFSRAFTNGLVKDGGDCNDDLECADEGTCIRDAGDDDSVVITTAGKCQAAAAEGEDCAERLCQSGLACTFDAETGDQTCTAVEPKANGEGCFDDSECESGFCTDQDVLRCSASGDACTDDSDCDADNFETCDEDFLSVCADRGDITICDGK